MGDGVTVRGPSGRECECAMCGELFGGEWAFDRHLRGRPTWDCVDPSTVVDRDGRPVLRAHDVRGRRVWSQPPPSFPA